MGKWIFPGNNYGTENGLDTTDMETFKKDPIASLSRESCQNSIDARSGEEPVRIEFNSFKVKASDIPGINDICENIRKCLAYQEKRNNTRDRQQLQAMLNGAEKSEINILRISDFNTKGLQGASSRDDTPFYLLTHGNGKSDKVGTAGGSKGIGKFASFVVSDFNTVFYNTKNIDGEEAYLGICKLCSAPIEGSDERTQGVGYYTNDKKRLMPIMEQINLDPAFIRTEPGTDVYIIGFKEEESWEHEVISKILDSFMLAIYKGDLLVKVNDTTIDKNNLGDEVNRTISSPSLWNPDYSYPKYSDKIRSLYYLLSNPSVERKTIEIEDYGDVQVYVKNFSSDSSLATHKCQIIRYPYMSIQDFDITAYAPCSAVCIIPDNTLNKLFRNIENPQHTEWYFKSIQDDEERKKMKRLYRLLREKIQDFVSEVVKASSNSEVDMEGAGDYLPSVDDNIESGDVVTTNDGVPKIVRQTRHKIRDTIGFTPNEGAESLAPETGNYTEEGDETTAPQHSGDDSGNGALHNDDDNNSNIDGEGDNEALTKVALSGMRYIFFKPKKNSGKCIVSFNSKYSQDDCTLELFYLDDSGNRYKVDIIEGKINGLPCEIKDGKAVGLNINNREHYKVELETNLLNFYSCEVRMYAYR